MMLAGVELDSCLNCLLLLLKENMLKLKVRFVMAAGGVHHMVGEAGGVQAWGAVYLIERLRVAALHGGDRLLLLVTLNSHQGVLVTVVLL
jgi:hypothetical protein